MIQVQEVRHLTVEVAFLTPKSERFGDPFPASWGRVLRGRPEVATATRSSRDRPESPAKSVFGDVRWRGLPPGKSVFQVGRACGHSAHKGSSRVTMI